MLPLLVSLHLHLCVEYFGTFCALEVVLLLVMLSENVVLEKSCATTFCWLLVDLHVMADPRNLTFIPFSFTTVTVSTASLAFKEAS